MNEYKRMAAILLILIFAIADLSLTVLKDFEESGIKRDRRYMTDTVDAIGDKENWDPLVTEEAVSDNTDGNNDAAEPAE